MDDPGITGVMERVQKKYDTQASEGVMIALLPTSSEWCRIEHPHMTLVYAGEMRDLAPNAFNELAKDAAMLAMMNRVIGCRVIGTEVFGGDGEEKVDVLRLEPSSELYAMRRAVERWNASQYPFRPHATIGPTGTFLDVRPSYLTFDRVCVGWGDEYLTFWLKR